MLSSRSRFRNSELAGPGTELGAELCGAAGSVLGGAQASSSLPSGQSCTPSHLKKIGIHSSISRSKLRHGNQSFGSIPSPSHADVGGSGFAVEGQSSSSPPSMQSLSPSQTQVLGMQLSSLHRNPGVLSWPVKHPGSVKLNGPGGVMVEQFSSSAPSIQSVSPSQIQVRGTQTPSLHCNPAQDGSGSCFGCLTEGSGGGGDDFTLSSTLGVVVFDFDGIILLDRVVVIGVGALLDIGSGTVSGFGTGFGTVSGFGIGSELDSGSGSCTVSGSGSELDSGSGSGAVLGSVPAEGMQLSSSLLSRQSTIPSHLQLSGMQGPCTEDRSAWTESVMASPGCPSRHWNSASEHLHRDIRLDSRYNRYCVKTYT